MKKIIIKKTNLEFIRLVKLELVAKSERMDKYFSTIKNMKKELDNY